MFSRLTYEEVLGMGFGRKCTNVTTLSHLTKKMRAMCDTHIHIVLTTDL